MKLQPITGKTSLVGLIGGSLANTLHPMMHNAAFVELGLDWAYVPLPVRPDPDTLEIALSGLVALNFVGINVTRPHKQAVMRYMDELSNAARFTGAVNTILIQEGEFLAYNSDAVGFLNSLKEAGCRLDGLRVVVLGAGGAARSVVYALARSGATVITVLNRTAKRAAFLVEDLAEIFPNCTLSFEELTPPALAALNGQIDLVVNTTSVGMYPDAASSPWPAQVPILKTTIFYDLVYNPLETRFLAQARAAGAPTIDGLGMLIHQGAFALETWTGYQAPLQVMRQACLDGLTLNNRSKSP